MRRTPEAQTWTDGQWAGTVGLAHRCCGHRRQHRQHCGYAQGVVAAGTPLLIEVRDHGGQLVEGRIVIEAAGYEPDALGQPGPALLPERGASMLPDRVVDQLGEVLVGPIPAGETDQRETRRQQPTIGQVINRRHQFFAGQVPGHTEDDDTARTGDPGETLVAAVPQRVDLPFDGRWCTLLAGTTRTPPRWQPDLAR
jgi:hypothetical protein